MKVTAKNKLGGSYVPLSGNVAFYDKNFPLYQVLDFITAEWVDDRKTLSGFLDMVRFSERLGKRLVGTPASDDLNLHRSLFSSAYALGNHMILPFDVYVDSNTDRYHVPLEKFKDLTDFARSNGQKLDDTLAIETYGSSREPITGVEKYCGGRICDKKVASWDRTLIRHARMDQFKTIAKGSKVLINGKTYETVASSLNGSIYLKAADWTSLNNFGSEKLGIESIVGPMGQPVFDLTTSLYSGQMPAWSAPRVKSVDFGISKVGHTTIRTTLEDLDFPRGTEFGFAETKYMDATDVGTRVGQIYFNANLIDKVFPGQALSWIQKPGQQRRYFETSSVNPGFLKFPAGDYDLLASVRKKRVDGKTQSILHLINWSSQGSGDTKRLRSTVIDVDFEKIFGFAPSSVTKCQLSQAGVPGEVLIKPQQIVGNGRYSISVKDLWTWGMITCN